MWEQTGGYSSPRPCRHRLQQGSASVNTVACTTPKLTALSLFVANIVFRVSRVTGFFLLFLLLVVIIINESFQVPLLILIIQIFLFLFLI